MGLGARAGCWLKVSSGATTGFPCVDDGRVSLLRSWTVYHAVVWTTVGLVSHTVDCVPRPPRIEMYKFCFFAAVSQFSKLLCVSIGALTRPVS